MCRTLCCDWLSTCKQLYPAAKTKSCRPLKRQRALLNFLLRAEEYKSRLQNSKHFPLPLFVLPTLNSSVHHASEWLHTLQTESNETLKQGSNKLQRVMHSWDEEINTQELYLYLKNRMNVNVHKYIETYCTVGQHSHTGSSENLRKWKLLLQFISLYSPGSGPLMPCGIGKCVSSFKEH